MVWVPPGGGIEEGEQPAEAAVRELFEKTGSALAPVSSGARSPWRQAPWTSAGRRPTPTTRSSSIA